MSDLLERFCRYARVDTQSDEASESYPSTEKQKDLSKMLEGELRELGLSDAKMDKWGIVTATIPATVEAKTPVMAWAAHVDTSPETSGTDVNPVIHKNGPSDDLTPTLP